MLAGAKLPCDWALDRAGRLSFAAHAAEQDDLHLATATHPGGIVWSAVVGSLPPRGVSLGEALAAATCGYELTVRLAEALGPEHRGRWHVTATAGTVGAAGAAARILGGDEAVVDAAGHGASVAGGSVQAMIERSGTRFVHRAHAASSGVSCARAAVAGLGASRGVLTPGRGTVGLPAEELPPPAATPAIEQTGFRLYPGTGFAHAAMAATLSAGRFEPGRIAAVTVSVSPPAALAIASNPAPADDGEVWWSIEHAVATCLATGDPDTAGRLAPDPEIVGLCRRIELAPGPGGWEATVEVTLDDGTRFSGSAPEPPGQGDRPATNDDLRAKRLRLTGVEGGELERLQQHDPGASFRAVVGDLLASSPAAVALVG